MILRGIDFGHVLGGSGVQGFFGEGYWFHPLFAPFGLTFNGMTFVSKTATLHPNAGNMRLTEKYTPKELLPSCIWMDRPFGNIVLNSVGLSNPGLRVLLGGRNDGWRWQARNKPFFISIALIEETAEERIREAREIARIFLKHIDNFRAPFGIQLNISCPNVGTKTDKLIDEISLVTAYLKALDVPLMIKINVLIPVEIAAEISKYCDALCVSNSIPFGALPDKIDWELHTGSATHSPLKSFGGGALSGKPLLRLVTDWLLCVREEGITIPINGGGGISECADVHMLKLAGASSVFIASVAMRKPWRVQSIIDHANMLFE